MSDISFHDWIIQASLENCLEEFFSSLDYKSLGLLPYAKPLIVQSLPREPLHHIVKKGFSDLAILKKHLIRKAILSLYENYLLKNKQQMILLTYVVPGGLGDYYAQNLFKKLLNQAFKNLDILSLSFVHETSPLHTENTLDDMVIRFEKQRDIHPSKLPKASIDSCSKASLLLQIPTYYPYLKQFVKKIKSSNPSLNLSIENIGEYGFIQSPHYEPSRSGRSLGLHFLEYGLLLPAVEPPTVMPSFFKEHLLKSSSLLDYKKTHLLFFSYLFTLHGHELYLYLLILMHTKETRHVDLVTVDIGPYLTIIDKNLSSLQSLPIQSIEIYYKNHVSSIPIHSQGLRLRIFHAGPLSHSDFYWFLNHSKEPIGIRGNLSLSESISLEKAFFYDPLQHNLALFQDLLSIAKKLTPSAHIFLKNCKESPDPLLKAHDMVDQIENHQALENMKELTLILKNQFCANPYLVNVVRRSLCHARHPHLLKKERSLVNAVTKERLELKELVYELTKSILKCNTSQQNPN